jgi:hypothetical protein
MAECPFDREWRSLSFFGALGLSLTPLLSVPSPLPSPLAELVNCRNLVLD